MERVGGVEERRRMEGRRGIKTEVLVNFDIPYCGICPALA